MPAWSPAVTAGVWGGAVFAAMLLLFVVLFRGRFLPVGLLFAVVGATTGGFLGHQRRGYLADTYPRWSNPSVAENFWDIAAAAGKRCIIGILRFRSKVRAAFNASPAAITKRPRPRSHPVGIMHCNGLTRCGAIRRNVARSRADDLARMRSRFCRYLRPPWTILWLFALVPDPKSPLSARKVDSPRVAAS